ncbi:MAG: DUF1992 domain-containing protein [Capsulimonadales bacterium]|nr:DUF1992 domain-containing protein [Capsulimonadales bacterium]
MSSDPMPDWTAIVADRKIKEAMDAGEFENLEGKGQPLNLDENPFETAGQRVINRILKQAGALPEWAMLAQEIHRELDALPVSRERGLRAVRLAKNEVSRERAAERLRQAHRERVGTINSLILKYNYSVPAAAQRPFKSLKLAAEMESLESDIAGAVGTG